MATCALIGQAAGTGAAVAVKHDCLPAVVTTEHMSELQKLLLDDGCFLPGVVRSVSSDAEVQVSGEEAALLANGWERPYDGKENHISVAAGGSLKINVKGGKTLRLALDPDFSRESITDHVAYQKFAMRTHVFGDLQANRPLNMPKNLLKSGNVKITCADGSSQNVTIANNRKPRIYLSLPENAVTIELNELAAWGGEEVNFFACDII
jgi:hypothetical protein